MNKQDCIDLGFNPMPHFTIGDFLSYDLGRNRQLSISCIGTPNEMMFISEVDGKKVTDTVVLHNYDYDGYLTKERLELYIKTLSKS